ncbi:MULTISPECIES: SAM-dependent methyltransferase [unclassified Lentimicrobium]|uniref:SAM-dependent methyltransferase n=1 Tax=unclassified Lentimicrobium TaxID=2677434 RepID=UPI001554A5E1|nr:MULTISPECIES: SAM-dependent methyltransferase [unclassified Lentimicrobium]NPD46990.1 SAM-dependent methyltransferase [Lentimicrobium sp. S6]NPD83917.1 SAM-dependent methyltransferase [Lentimicrobium sp. L6]
MEKKGKLYLIPNTLGESNLEDIIPNGNIEKILNIKHFIVEELRNARRFLSKAGWKGRIEELEFLELNEHSKPRDIISYLNNAEKGQDIGLLSDAGTPCVADPGADIVSMAHAKGIRVIPLVGPSSILLALMASGFNGQNFAFLGYLPRERGQRERTIKDLENKIFRQHQTQIFIEAPYRNNQMLESLIKTSSPTTKICVATDITLETELIISDTAQNWKKRKDPIDIHKRNTIFLLYK